MDDPCDKDFLEQTIFIRYHIAKYCSTPPSGKHWARRDGVKSRTDVHLAHLENTGKLSGMISSTTSQKAKMLRASSLP